MWDVAHNMKDKRTNNDHDLLITLNTKFESFESSFSRAFLNLEDKMSRILIQMEQKADKSDIKLIQEELKSIDGRVRVVEDKIQKDETKKELIINLGNMGLKGWTILTGFVLFIIAIINAIKK